MVPISPFAPQIIFFLPTSVATIIKSANVEMIVKTLILNTIDVVYGSKEPLIPIIES
jgi:hypothetical protein